MKRLSYLAAAGLMLLSTVPAMAQGRGNNDNNGNNSENSGCSQTTSGGNGPTAGGQQDNMGGEGSAALAGVIDVLIQNVSILNNIKALNGLNGSNLQLVCLNDVLNQNDIRILQDVLNGSPILSKDLNGSLNNNNVLNGLLQGSNIALLNNVQVIAVNLGTGQVFLLRQA